MNRICDNCVKVDVCKFKEEFMNTVNKIRKIQEEMNLIQADISCKKYNAGYNKKATKKAAL